MTFEEVKIKTRLASSSSISNGGTTFFFLVIPPLLLPGLGLVCSFL